MDLIENSASRMALMSHECVHKCTEVRFASFFSGGFIIAMVVNPPERRLAKCTSVTAETRTASQWPFTCLTQLF